MSADFDAVTLTNDPADNQQEFDMTNQIGATLHVDYQKGADRSNDGLVYHAPLVVPKEPAGFAPVK